MKTPAWLKLPFKLGQLGLALAGVIVVLVMVDFNRQLTSGKRIAEDKHLLETQVVRLEREQSALKTQIAYATTDASVVEWAHGQGKLVQEGEVIVIPVAPPGSTPTPVDQAAPTVLPIPNWRLWLGLFIDTELTGPIP